MLGSTETELLSNLCELKLSLSKNELLHFISNSVCACKWN